MFFHVLFPVSVVNHCRVPLPWTLSCFLFSGMEQAEEEEGKWWTGKDVC